MELSRVLVSLADNAAMSLKVEAAAVCLLDESSRRLRVAAVHGLPAETLNRAPQDIHACGLEREALAGLAVLAADERQELLGEWAGENLRSGLCIPLVHEGKPLGTLGVYAAQPARFCREDASTLEPLAELGAAAIAAAQALAELKTMELQQAQFIRIATHELRSPVTVSQSLVRSVLKGYAGAMSDKQAEVFTRISRRLDLLETLINDLLDLAAGKAAGAAKAEPVLLNASIGRVVLLLQPRAEDKGIRVTFQPHRGQLIVRGTEDGLDRIFVNLVGNAIKYTPTGGAVAVSVQQKEGQAQVEISDTGIGIPEQAMPELFKEFYRAPNAKQSGEVGTGLGLAIAKNLAEQYGGRIHVKSSEGRGTTFTVTFPLIDPNGLENPLGSILFK
ncbi:MAG: GAF domain-containing sensor histidine kinase [Thermoflexales bacterium]|nr:GAF domain-containing sensor histidine kinase [Thermoflexales bacterium]